MSQKILKCPKMNHPVVIDENNICNASANCDGILDTDAVEYVLHESKNLPPELSGPTRIIGKGNRCLYKKQKSKK